MILPESSLTGTAFPVAPDRLSCGATAPFPAYRPFNTRSPMPKRLNADDREMLADLRTLLLAAGQNAQAAASGEDVAEALGNLAAQLAQAQAAVVRLRERHDAAN